MANYTIEKARAQLDKNKVEKEKAALFQNIGALVYNLHISGEVSIEQCSEIYSEVDRCNNTIRDIDAYIQQLETQKLQQQRMYKNPYGNYGGTPQQNQQPEGGKFCSNCGTRNSETAKFCSGCGSPV